MKLAEIGEGRLIASLARRATGNDQLLVGIGDDAAVVRPAAGADLLLTCDLLCEDVHFRRAWYDGCPQSLGRKALGASISDIAAKGGRPRHCLVTLAAAADVELDCVQRVFDGLAALADEWGVSVAGGDTVGWRDGLLIDVFLTGEVEASRAILRRGARPGDIIAVTGEFGLARAGLELLERGARHDRPVPTDYPALDARLAAATIARQIETPVRLGEARAIAATGQVRAMSDTSDGLAVQVHHLCQAGGLGARLDAAKVPVGRGTAAVARAAGAAALEWALWGGEDYELILAVAPADFGAVAAATEAAGGAALTAVGEFTAAPDVLLRHGDGSLRRLPNKGYDHFGPRGEAGG